MSWQRSRIHTKLYGKLSCILEHCANTISLLLLCWEGCHTLAQHQITTSHVLPATLLSGSNGGPDWDLTFLWSIVFICLSEKIVQLLLHGETLLCGHWGNVSRHPMNPHYNCNWRKRAMSSPALTGLGVFYLPLSEGKFPPTGESDSHNSNYPWDQTLV